MKESLKNKIRSLQHKVTLTAAIAGGMILAPNKLSAQTPQETLSIKNENVSESVMLASKPSYLNYHLSFEERKAALDEAVQKGEVRLEEKDAPYGKDVIYRNNDAAIVAKDEVYDDVTEEKLVGGERVVRDAGSAHFQFYTDSATLEYTILKAGVEVQLEGTDIVRRSDRYDIRRDKNGHETAMIESVDQRTETAMFLMNYSKGKLSETVVEDRSGNTIERDTYVFAENDNLFHRHDTFDQEGNLLETALYDREEQIVLAHRGEISKPETMPEPEVPLVEPIEKPVVEKIEIRKMPQPKEEAQVGRVYVSKTADDYVTQHCICGQKEIERPSKAEHNKAVMEHMLEHMLKEQGRCKF